MDKIPPHVELMKRLEIADYEPASDPGNMRFYPKGKLIGAIRRLRPEVSVRIRRCGSGDADNV